MCKSYPERQLDKAKYISDGHFYFFSERAKTERGKRMLKIDKKIDKMIDRQEEY